MECIETIPTTMVTIEEEPEESAAAVTVEASDGFILTPQVERLTARALTYLEVGYPVHFSGPAGTGKTTLALHVASLRERPVMLIHGDDEFGSSDLIGSSSGYQKSRIVDNYVHSVLKTEERVNTYWADNRLTVACRNGDTLVYDEFTRSRPEANNVLLSALEERLLTLPTHGGNGDGYLEVHENFRAIFTSNPEEYAGVHRTQDALMDRLITINVDYFDRETEIEITRARSGLAHRDAALIVDIVRDLRKLGVSKHPPSTRACIMIGRVCALQNANPHGGSEVFVETCRDVLAGLTAKILRENDRSILDHVDRLIAKHTDADYEPAPRPMWSRVSSVSAEAALSAMAEGV